MCFVLGPHRTDRPPNPRIATARASFGFIPASILPRTKNRVKYPAVLKVNIYIKIEIPHPGSGPNPGLLKEKDSPDPPPGPPGGEGGKNKLTNVLKYSWGMKFERHVCLVWFYLDFDFALQEESV